MARLFADDRGAAAIEYALVASLISAAIVGAALSLGNTIQTTLYDKIVAAFSGL